MIVFTKELFKFIDFLVVKIKAEANEKGTKKKIYGRNCKKDILFVLNRYCSSACNMHHAYPIWTMFTQLRPYASNPAFQLITA